MRGRRGSQNARRRRKKGGRRGVEKRQKMGRKGPDRSTFEEPRLIYNGQRCGGIRHQYHADARPRGQLSCWTKATGVYTTIPHVARVYAARVAHGSLRS